MMRRGPRAGTLAAILLAPLIAGCLGTPDIHLATSAPKAGGGLTILLATDKAVDGATKAYYEIRKDGEVVYPLGGFLSKGGWFYVGGRQGEAFVPYHYFVVGNGNYEVAVKFDDREKSTLVGVEKWAEYVYMYAYEKDSRVVVDLQLSTQQGGFPSDRVIAEGRLILEIVYRGVDGNDQERVKVVQDRTSDERTFTRLTFPKSTFDRGPGWYSFEATFHNGQALGNNNVGNDPTMDKTSPPRNWVCMSPCA